MVMNNPADPTDISYELLVDLSASVTGLSDTHLAHPRRSPPADNGNLYIADNDTRSIYEVVLDGSGDFVSISKLFDLDAAHGSRFQPMGIIFNEFTGKLNYIEQDIDSGNLERRIVELNLDGTGHSVLLDDTEASALYAVPAPSALALLGLGGLAAARRRR